MASGRASITTPEAAVTGEGIGALQGVGYPG